MIPYNLPQEKETILHYAHILDDKLTTEIIQSNQLRNKAQAVHLANFFWKMVDASNEQDEMSGESSEYILEKIIITFMAYFRSTGYEEIWENISDAR